MSKLKIITWINNSIDNSIDIQLVKYKTTKKIWEHLKRLYTQSNFAFPLFVCWIWIQILSIYYIWIQILSISICWIWMQILYIFVYWIWIQILFVSFSFMVLCLLMFLFLDLSFLHSFMPNFISHSLMVWQLV